MDANKETNIYCVDCQSWTRQKCKGINPNDKTYLYVCTECGCENSVPVLIKLTNKQHYKRGI